MKKITTLVAFKKFLDAHGIDYASWGIGATKTVERLFYEYLSGESTFIIRRKQLIRIVRRVQVLIYYKTSKGTRFMLIEKRQIFKNGSIRKRSRLRSLSEKMTIEESALEAALRALKEETGITGIDPVEFIALKPLRRGKPKNSRSYPGMPSIHYGPRFKLVLARRSAWYDRNGYNEIQQDKRTEFRWRQLHKRK